MLKLAVHLACFCGLRRGEIFGLTLADVDLKERRIHVRHSMTRFDELKAPKTSAGERTVPMPRHVQELLADWLAHSYVTNERRVLLVNRNGKSGQTLFSNFNTSWRRLLDRAGLSPLGQPAYNFHALRHFAASWAMQMGMAPPDVAAFLGHRTFDMTLQVYAHPVYDDAARQHVMDRNASELIQITGPAATTARQGRLSA